jgi:hypothetical protein
VLALVLLMVLLMVPLLQLGMRVTLLLPQALLLLLRLVDWC